MKQPMQWISATALATATLLAGCGGGGGGGSDTPAGPPQAPAVFATPNVALSTSNQDAAARAAVNASAVAGRQLAAVPLSSLGQVVASAKISGSKLTPSTSPELAGGATYGALLLRMTRYAVESPLSATVAPVSGQTTIAALISNTYNCTGGGTIVGTLDDRNNNQQIDANETATITFNNCRENGAALNGSVSAIYTAVGTSVTATVSYANFSVVAPDGTVAINGSATASVGTLGSVTTTTLTIGQNGLTVYASANTAGFTDALRFGPNFTVVSADNQGAVPAFEEVSINGRLSSLQLNGTISINTTTAFRTLATDVYPSQGLLTITGAAGGSIRVTALSNTQVRIELDANADNVYETTRTVNWADLL